MTSNTTPFPLSFPQRSIWHTSRAGDRWSAGYAGLELWIRGDADIPAVVQSFHDVVRRHASLRTVVSRGDQPILQRVLDDIDPPVRIWDRTREPVGGQLCTIDWRELGVDNEIPIRADLFKISTQEHVLLISTHRIAVDASSQNIICADLSQAYHARRTGHAPAWGRPDAEYEDFVRWHATTLGDEAAVPREKTAFARHVRFWQRYLAGLELPDIADAAKRAPREELARLPIELPTNLLASARRIAGSVRVSVAMVLRASVASAIARISGKHSILLGSIVPGRYQSRFSHVVGSFETALIFRYDKVTTRPFGELLLHVRDREVEAHRRPYLPAAYVTRLVFRRPAEEVIDAFVVVRDSHSPCPLTGLETVARLRGRPIEESSLGLELWESRDADDLPCMQGLLDCRSGHFDQSECMRIWTLAQQLLADATAELPIEEDSQGSEWRLSPLLHKNQYLPPHDPLQHTLVPIWEDVLRCTPVGVWDEFDELGGSAKMMETIRQRAADLLGRSVPLQMSAQQLTVETLAESILESVPAVPSFLVRSGSDARPTLIILHGDINGGGLYVFELARYLGSCGTIYALPPHGANGMPVGATVEAMARDQLRVLRKLQPSGPYFLVGFCKGALIAYEIARELASRDEKIAFLGFIHSQFNLTRAQAEVQKPPPLPTIPTPPPDSPVWKIRRRASALRHASYREPMWAYHPDTYQGKITLLWPKEEAFGEESPVTIWRRVVPEVELRLVPGNHLTCITAHARQMGCTLNACIQSAQNALVLQSSR